MARSHSLCCWLVLASACGGRQVGAGEETETGAEPNISDLPDPDPPSCDGTPPSAVEIGPSGEGLVSSSGGRMFWEPDSERLILFGGLRKPHTYADSVLEIDPVTLTSRLLEWAPGPSFEATHVNAAKDPFAPRWWFVGGVNGTGLETEVLEVRLVDDRLTAKQHPPLPSTVVDHVVGFDPVSGRLVYTLGWDGFPPDVDYREQTFVLKPDAGAPVWAELADAGGPPGQRDADIVWVPTLGLLLLAHVDPFVSGIWQLATDSDEWIERDISPPPGHHDRARLFWDDPSCRLILWTDGYYFDGVETVAAIWIIDPFSEPMSAIALPRPEPATTYGRNAGYDPVHRIVIEHGGANFDVDPSDYTTAIDSFLLD